VVQPEIEAGAHLDADAMRTQMRHVVSPVTVVTAGSADRALGITIGSFASTALTPPLISFNLSHGARMFEILPFEETFIVHVLAGDQSALSERFAVPDMPGPVQFAEVEHFVHDTGTPVLVGAVTVLLCRVYSIFPAGDHSLVVGRVTAVLDENPKEPLIYYNQHYRMVGAEVRARGASEEIVDGTPNAPNPKNAKS
jgi:flavin reductase (DIM6/NTAB) family NADH-FMN oxidoreductase RutF